MRILALLCCFGLSPTLLAAEGEWELFPDMTSANIETDIEKTGRIIIADFRAMSSVKKDEGFIVITRWVRREMLMEETELMRWKIRCFDTYNDSAKIISETCFSSFLPSYD